MYKSLSSWYMPEEKILAKHPEGKRSLNISKAKYETIRKIILECLKKKSLTHTNLINYATHKLKGNFNGTIH